MILLAKIGILSGITTKWAKKVQHIPHGTNCFKTGENSCACHLAAMTFPGFRGHFVSFVVVFVPYGCFSDVKHNNKFKVRLDHGKQ